MLNEVTAEDALAALERVVAGREDFIYEPVVDDSNPDDLGRCVYVHNNSPSCGVGYALADLGFSIEVIAALDPVQSYGGIGASEIGILDGVPFTEGAGVVLEKFQGEQDQGMPWGQALMKAKEEYELYHTSVDS